MELIPNVKALKMANIIGVSESAIDKDIRKLKDEKYIIREGSRKSGRWRIISRKE